MQFADGFSSANNSSLFVPTSRAKFTVISGMMAAIDWYLHYLCWIWCVPSLAHLVLQQPPQAPHSPTQTFHPEQSSESKNLQGISENASYGATMHPIQRVNGKNRTWSSEPRLSVLKISFSVFSNLRFPVSADSKSPFLSCKEKLAGIY